MSYARMGFDSDVYLYGTYRNGLRVIECCGCSLAGIPVKDGEKVHWPSGFPAFSTAVGACEHLDRHRKAGDKVPGYAYDAILADDDWLRGDDVPAGGVDGDVRPADGAAEEGTGA